MSDHITIDKTQGREAMYQQLLPQINGLLEGETHWLAGIGNAMAALKYNFGFFWVGVYLVEDGQLVLGPFQGPVACSEIQKGKGVCGQSWLRNETLVVPDVEAFPGHIACSSQSRSEIVVPIHDNNGKVVGVLDIDSDRLNEFSELDQQYLETLVTYFTRWF